MKAEHRLRVSENEVLKRMFGFKRKEVQENRENIIMRKFIIFIVCKLLLFYLDVFCMICRTRR